MCARGCTEQNIASCKRSGKSRGPQLLVLLSPQVMRRVARVLPLPNGQMLAMVWALRLWCSQIGSHRSLVPSRVCSGKKVHDLLFQRRKWQVPRDLWENKDQLETVTCLASETHTVESIKAVLEERRAWMQAQGLRVIGMERTSTQTMSAGRPPSESVTVTLMKSRKIVLTAVKQTWTAVEFAHDTLTRFCTFC